ncbi:MAG: type 1 glutamine amidotransferase [Archaeoglobus sp.]|uniref:type 1 glutamine amidotransferase domain-containing protein n=1 Tax=Archaeoglobus sp. TaxID=1872626 RepID=UPI001DE60C1F|nr:type 1 glutamine amidotransferase domain-containing protein [Archaeoglobus sp.]MBO8179470.1 type 1 glutamine amidotransferase [Archaeoglobus sp.]
MKVLILVENDFEDLELFYPLYRLREEGYGVDVASSSLDVRVGKKGYQIKPDLSYEDVRVEEYAALVIPGGKAPERIRINEKAVEIVRRFLDLGEPVAAICHGPQLLISAGAVKGRRMTSWIGIRDDLIAAGAEYVDAEVVVDGNIITSRMPDDLPAFCRELIKMLKRY